MGKIVPYSRVKVKKSSKRKKDGSNRYIEGVITSFLIFPVLLISYLLTGKFYFYMLWLIPFVWLSYVSLSK
ncbi:MAG: hypothetical protein NWE89_04170 [Candidatus Bathyarchaeota archaeon]|nr:hypothetical protein [Candidatus Bathyarchaeota archaeon]